MTYVAVVGDSGILRANTCKGEVKPQMTNGVPRRAVGETILEALKARIDQRDWQVGSQLPSIRDLSKEYGVAPLTMSRVLNKLGDDGYVRILPSKGVFVLDRRETIAETPTGDTSWQRSLLRRLPPRSYSVTLPKSVPEGTINLATGTMSNQAIPIQSIQRAIRRVADSYVEGPVSVRSPIGEYDLRSWIATYLHQFEIYTSAENTLIVSTSHQSFRVIGAAIIEPDDVILIETPSDPIVMGTFELAGARCITVPVDHNGMMVEQVADLIERYRPKAIVTCSSGQIPTGVTMSIDRRRALVDLCVASRCVIVEYDNGNEVWYGNPPPNPIKSWDTDGTVIYIREYSRVTAAGLRIASISVEGPIFQRLVECKRRDDLLTSTISQFELLEYVRGPDFAKNLNAMRDYYQVRREAALTALSRHMPTSVTWFRPDVGFHIWATLPPELSARGLTQEAAARGVIVAPSEIFSLDGKLDNGIRITFSDNEPEAVAEGIRRLGETATWMLQDKSPETSHRVFEVV